MASNNNGNSNQLLVPGVRQALDQMKNEIANEFGVQMGPDATSRANGSVGGEITKRLVRQAQSQMKGFNQEVSFSLIPACTNTMALFKRINEIGKITD